MTAPPLTRAAISGTPAAGRLWTRLAASLLSDPFRVEGGIDFAQPAGEPALVGRVIGTDDATPLEFWVGVADGAYLQLDDVVALERPLPGGEAVRVYGVVSQVRARHDGARFDRDVFLIADGVLPAEVSQAALVQATRFEPEIFVPPLPGQAVRRAVGPERFEALFFDVMAKRLAQELHERNTAAAKAETARAAP